MATSVDKGGRVKQRAHGTGSIIQASSGIYKFQYRDAAGRRVTKSLQTRNYRQAAKNAEPLVAMLQVEDTVVAVHQMAKARALVDNGALPFDEVWEAFMATRPQAGEGTLDNYRRDFKRFMLWISDKHAEVDDYADVTVSIAREWLREVWSEGIAPSTFNNIRGSLNAITAALVASGGDDTLKVNPWASTVGKKVIKQQKRLALSPDQAAKIGSIETSPENHALLMLALYAGMRLKDAALLKKTGLIGRTIQYTPAKTERTSGVTATVPILPPLQAALEALPVHDGEYVLPETAESYLRRTKTVKDRVLKLVQNVTGDAKNEVEGVQIQRSLYGYHSLRHTFCTEAARAGASAAELQAMTGDSLQTLGRFYVAVKIDQLPNANFSRLALMASGRDESERDELKRLADELPLEEVCHLLKVAKGRTLPS